MRKTTVILLLVVGLAALALARLQRSQRGPFRNLKGWQKMLGLVAILMAVIVILNPDLLALGLLGDSTFFDMLALALSVQMLGSVQWAWQSFSKGLVRGLRWLGIPSPGFRYLMCASMIAITNVTSLTQKLMHQIFDL
jgi:hypothetical protein